MNKEDIIRMAQECQLIGMRPHLDGIYEAALERFAELISAHEREACEHICVENGALGLAAAIRARGEK